MSASAYLIVIIGLAAIFAAGVFVGARLEYSNPRVATFAYRLGLLSGYAAGMIAVGWALWTVVPPGYDALVDQFGSKPVFFSLFVLWAAGAIWVYVVHQRHDQRQRSGKFLEPREP